MSAAEGAAAHADDSSARERSAPPPHAWAALRDLRAHLRFWAVVVFGLALDLWSKDWAFQKLGQGDKAEVLIPGVLELHTTLNKGALFGIGAGQTGIFLLASVLALVLVLWMFAQSEPRRWLLHIALGAILAGALGNMYDRMFVKLIEYPPHVAQSAGPGVRWPPIDVNYPLAQRYYQLVRSTPAGLEVTDYPARGDPSRHLIPAEWAQGLEEVGCVRDFIKIPKRWLGGREMWPWVFNVADSLLVSGVVILGLRMLAERKKRPAAADVPPAAPRAALDGARENT